MPRKRAAAAEITNEPTDAPDVFDEQIALRQAEAAQVVQDVADSTRLPEQNGTSFAEKVGRRQYQPAPDPFGIASDYVAGVHLSESRRYGKMLLAFDEKPTPEVTGKLKDAGFRWEPQEKVWTLGTYGNPMSARIEADRVFKEVSKLIREQRGIEHSAGMSV
jgi:hypothetical protein